jgi:hypothetical protein
MAAQVAERARVLKNEPFLSPATIMAPRGVDARVEQFNSDWRQLIG